MDRRGGPASLASPVRVETLREEVRLRLRLGFGYRFGLGLLNARERYRGEREGTDGWEGRGDDGRAVGEPGVGRLDRGPWGRPGWSRSGARRRRRRRRRSPRPGNGRSGGPASLRAVGVADLTKEEIKLYQRRLARR